MIEDDPISAILRVLPPETLVMAIHQAFFDESGTDDGARFMSVAGYLFKAGEAERFSRDWRKVLKKYNLPYAHMTDANTGKGFYKHLSEDDCDKVSRLLIEHIKRHALGGVGFVADVDLFKSIVGPMQDLAPLYAVLIQRCVMEMIGLARSMALHGRIFFSFEQGHPHSSVAHANVDKLKSVSPDNPFYSQVTALGDYHAGHGFFSKADAPPLQAADMLAWSMTKHCKRMLAGQQGMRGDTRALYRPHRDKLLTLGPEEMATVRMVYQAKGDAFMEDLITDRISQHGSLNIPLVIAEGKVVHYREPDPDDDRPAILFC